MALWNYPLFAYGCWGVLYKYLNTIQYNTIVATFRRYSLAHIIWDNSQVVSMTSKCINTLYTYTHTHTHEHFLTFILSFFSLCYSVCILCLLQHWNKYVLTLHKSDKTTIRQLVLLFEDIGKEKISVGFSFQGRGFHGIRSYFSRFVGFHTSKTFISGVSTQKTPTNPPMLLLW